MFELTQLAKDTASKIVTGVAGAGLVEAAHQMPAEDLIKIISQAAIALASIISVIIPLFKKKKKKPQAESKVL